MASVQFYGVDAVLTAAENRNCPGWGIFIGKNLFMKYEGDNNAESLDMLRAHLESLEPAGTTAIYTIKFFEQPGSGSLKINEKTICNGGSFNFKLVDPEQRQIMYGGHINNKSEINALREKIDHLESLLEQKLSQEDEEEMRQPNLMDTIGNVVADAISDPEKLFMYINAGRAMFGLPVVDTKKAIGNIMGNTQLQQQPTSTDPGERLHNALTILEKHDPKLIEHLEKLAAMAVNESMKFKMLINML